ncbi:MAG: mandelate racemase/muconate lactonizing enzyme family protein [Deltaproteobacteria bacterium]|nr:MAG: mandelate racemase/muconate lactonizing enzyme family protein [Deltaproteobacteria bacterium]
MIDFIVYRIEIYVLRAPIQTPVKTSFGVMNDRPAVLVRVEDKDGAFGWGEVWCNFPDCGAEHRAGLIESVLAPVVIGHRFIKSVFQELTEVTKTLAIQTGEFGPIAQAIAGLDTAFWDLASRRTASPLYRFLGGQTRSVPVYASGINPDKPVETVERCRQSGHCAFKLKVGFDIDSDIGNIKAVVDTLKAQEILMIDANQAWNLDLAKGFIREISELPIFWIEEPIKADRPADEWIALADFSPIPLAAGENYFDKEIFKTAIDSGSLRFIQPDISKWGGLTGCKYVAEEAKRADLKFCPHYLSGGIGFVASLQLFAGVNGDGLVEMDANQNPLREALAQPFPKLEGGRINLNNEPGLGVAPDINAVRRYLVLHRDIH